MTATVLTQRTSPLRSAIIDMCVAGYAALHVIGSGKDEQAARDRLFDACSYVMWQLIPEADRAEFAEAMARKVDAP